MLATVIGQDLEQDTAGVFRIARKVAKDRVISTVDPQARHGHKGHVALDPDSEIVTATTVTPGNSDDAEAAETLLADDLPPAPAADGDEPAAAEAGEPPLAVYGDAAYGAGHLLERLENAAADVKTKVQPPVAPAGHFPKTAFTRDPAAGTATCPAGITVPVRPVKNGGGTASFGPACASCPLREQTHQLGVAGVPRQRGVPGSIQRGGLVGRRNLQHRVTHGMSSLSEGHTVIFYRPTRTPTATTRRSEPTVSAGSRP